jgi:hypothetical protein
MAHIRALGMCSGVPVSSGFFYQTTKAGCVFKGVQTTDICLSQFQRLEVQNQVLAWLGSCELYSSLTPW